MDRAAEQWSGCAEPSLVAELRRAATTFAEDAGFCGMALADVRACVSEAVTNSVVHGFPDERPCGTVSLSARLAGDELVYIVSDDGTGFRADVDSPGLGLGLPMIAAVTTSMAVTVADAGGTQVRMAFAREPAPAPAA